MNNIVLLHGWGQNAPVNIEPLASSLRAKGYTVFLPHLPGFGVEDPPQTPWAVDDYVIWVLEKVRSEKGWDSYILCGHSFGGRVALKLTARHPEKVQKLILIASAGLRQNLSLKARILRLTSNVGRRIFDLPLLRLLQGPVHAFWRTILGQKDYYQVSGVMQKTFVRVIAEDLAPSLPNITKPTFILWGKKDQYVSVEDAYTIHDAIPSSQVKVFSQADHFLPYNEPDELAGEIDLFVRGSIES